MINNIKWIIVAVCLALNGCGSFYAPKLIFNDDHISVFSQERLTINPHGNGYQYAIVLGKRYDYIIGSPPYYVFINEGKQMLFVTEDYGSSKPQPTTVWVISIENGEVKKGIFRNSKFGNDLNRPHSEYRDEVIPINKNTLLLRANNFNGSITDTVITLKPTKKSP